jgi:hypothetical protein
MRSPVDVVSEEEIVGIGKFPSYFEDLQDIKELSMHISYNCHGEGNPLDILFFDEDIFEFAAQYLNGMLIEQFAFEGFFEESFHLKSHYQYYLN